MHKPNKADVLKVAEACFCDKESDRHSSDLMRFAAAMYAAGAEAMRERADDLADLVSKAMRKSWQLGQLYWQQADSDSQSQWKKSDETQAKFGELVDSTVDAIRKGEQG
ncbi:MAG: hypothetical protein ACYCZR_12875 [Burkholderiales bacterium]